MSEEKREDLDRQEIEGEKKERGVKEQKQINDSESPSIDNVLEKSDEIYKKIDQMKSELQNEKLDTSHGIEDKTELIPNNMIFIIPSWGDLLGYPNKLGFYLNKEVAKITSDFIIFFGGLECAFRTEKGIIYYLFGLGLYNLTFELVHNIELSMGKYITDSKLLTGLILPDFVYDKLATSEDLTLEDDPDVVIAENVIKVPIDVTYKTQNKQTLIKGALMRNMFIPYKDIVLDFMNKIQSPDHFDLESKGHHLLSAHPDFYNKILVSDKRKIYDPEGYLNSTAILDEIIYGADEILKNTFSSEELNKINSKIKNLKEIYSTLEFDPVYPYSIIENASKKITIKTIPISQRENSQNFDSSRKKSIFYSAQRFLDIIKEWPDNFPIYKKEDIELIKSSEEIIHPYMGDTSSYLEEKIDESMIKREEPPKEEDFKLRFEQSKEVGEKILPSPPTDNIENILIYLKEITESDFDMPSVGKALGLARDNIKNIHPVEYHTIKWELSKWANFYKKKQASISLSEKERTNLLETVQKWLDQFEKERLERERKERKEKERKERERKEKERLERLKQEEQRIEEERKKLEAERKERERLKKLREEQEKLKKQREKEKVEFERQQKLKEEQKRIEEERKRQEALEREAKELKKLKKERKKQAKLLKKQRKKQKKLEKKQRKIEKKKAKERKKLKEIKSELESDDKTT